MTKLYEISNQLVGLRKLIDEGELDETTLNDTLEALEGDLIVKSEGVLAHWLELDGDIAKCNAAIERIMAHRKRFQDQQDFFTNYLRVNMEKNDINKIEHALFTATLRKAADVVVLESPDLIPDGYKTTETTTTTKISKADIKRDLKANMDVPGARLEPGKRGILIK